MKRRHFAKTLGQISLGAYAGYQARPLFGFQPTLDATRPNITCGVASGDVGPTTATIWSRADRESQMLVEVADNPDFKRARKIRGPYASDVSDFTSKLRVNNLDPGKEWFYRIQYQDLNDLSRLSAPAEGRFRTSPDQPRSIKFAWSGDTAGQGYGIDVARGGMKTFETIRSHAPDFFVNSGDVIYADNPFPSELKLDDGTVWKNIVTEGTSKAAETLEEFRANYRYNMLDENVRRFAAEVPSFVQWDDHETLNNWYPTEVLTDDRYRDKSVALLSARARRAFFDYTPIRDVGDGMSRIFRNMPYGPLLELFFLDMRSYRGPNSANQQKELNADSALLGKQQIQWLKKSLLSCKSTWKVICSDMPLGLIVGDGKDFEACANGNGPAAGRELEIADLLSFIKQHNIQNVLWITADVHYAASYHYSPDRAEYKDFLPFWEFISGPLHAGTFGPAKLDNTFGPELRYKGIPDGMKGNRPPSEGYQFFGLIEIDGTTRALTVHHYNAANTKLWSVELPAV